MPRLLALLSLLLVAPCLGAKKDLPAIQATFYTFRFAPEHKSIYLRSGSDSFSELRLSTANMIGPQRVVVLENTVTLHDMATDAEGNTIYPVIGVARIKSGMTRALIVLAPNTGENEKHAYQALVIDNQASGFPKGSYKLVNMSPHPIRGAIGKTSKFECAAGNTVSFKTTGEPGQVMPVHFQYHDGTRWRTLTETRWTHSANSRSLLCAYRQNSTKRMKLRSIPDNTKPLPKSGSR